MQRATLNVSRRDSIGKGASRKTRAEGRIPAVLYGAGKDAEKVALDAHAFNKAVHGAKGSIFSIEYDGDGGEETAAIIREIQRDPVTRRVLHVDLYRIRMDVENEFDVPLHTTGLAAGVKDGGILETHLYTIAVRCLPDKLPSAIQVDVSDLQINHAIHVSDITVPEGVTFVTDSDSVVCTVLPPKEVAVAAPVEGAETEEPAQPEVIGKKKPEEAEGAAEKEKK